MSEPDAIIKEGGMPGNPERVPSPSPRHFGSCKWFNVSKGYGFVVDDVTKEDLFIHQSNLNMQGFRSLDQGERVSYYIQDRSNGKGKEAYAVSGEVEGQGLKGSRIHPLGRKKAQALRCFKCGKFTDHRAKNCPDVKADTKVCYNCGSEEHVSTSCPNRQKRGHKSSSDSEDQKIAKTSDSSEEKSEEKVEERSSAEKSPDVEKKSEN